MVESERCEWGRMASASCSPIGNQIGNRRKRRVANPPQVYQPAPQSMVKTGGEDHRYLKPEAVAQPEVLSARITVLRLIQ